MHRVWMGLVALVLAVHPSVSVVAAPADRTPRAPETASPIQQRQTPPCTVGLTSQRWPASNPRIEFEEANVGPAGSWGRPLLCAVYFPGEDVYNFMITGTDNVQQFRAAKSESIGRLQARGFDLCRASKWLTWGTRDQPGYTFDDYYDMTVPCGPQLRAGDPGAEIHLATVETSLARAMDAVAEELGTRPTFPFSVLVFTDQQAAVGAFKRYRATFESEQSAEAAAVNGASRSVRGSSTNYVYGHVMMINLTDPNYVTPAKIDLDVMSRYTFVSYTAAAGIDSTILSGNNSATPRWFEAGMFSRLSYRWAVGGANGGYLVEAARAAREGKIPPISALQTFDQEKAVMSQYDYYVVTARTYAVVTYLYERYGREAIVAILRESRNGSVRGFNDILGRMTGTDADGLDAAVTDWLLGLPSVHAASADGQIKVEGLRYGGGHQGEILVEETQARCLFDVSDPGNEVTNTPGLVGLSITIGEDGAFAVSRPSTRVGNAVALSGSIAGPGELSGSYRVTNDVMTCDSGPIQFTSASS